ncbi:MAG: hypothetical protein PHD67_06895 [Oscillospiraceae bacterium]|nr:hypothetical protein [Oscillospiraceae bacterium]
MMTGIAFPISSARFPLSLAAFIEGQERGLGRKMDSVERTTAAQAVEFINYAYEAGRAGADAPEVTPDGKADTARFYTSLATWTRAAWLTGCKDAKNDRRAFIRTLGRKPDSHEELAEWMEILGRKEDTARK